MSDFQVRLYSVQGSARKYGLPDPHYVYQVSAEPIESGFRFWASPLTIESTKPYSWEFQGDIDSGWEWIREQISKHHVGLTVEIFKRRGD